MDASAVKASLEKLKVVELKKELKERGLSLNGNKLELIDRLTETILMEKQPLSPLVGNKDSTVEALSEDALLGDIDELEVEGDLSAADLIGVDSSEPTEVAVGQENLTTTLATAKENIDHVVPIKGTEELQAQELEQRAQKYGLPLTDMERKKIRAARFNISTSGTVTASTGTGDTLRKREERFSLTGTHTVQTKGNSDAIEKRRQRFGVITQTDDTDKPRKRFGEITQTTLSATRRPAGGTLEERKRRFSQSTPSGKDVTSEEAKHRRAEKFGIS